MIKKISLVLFLGVSIVLVGNRYLINEYMPALDDSSSNAYTSEEIDEIVNDLNNQIASNKNASNNLSSEVTDNKDDLSTLNGVVTSDQTEIDNISNSISSLQSELENYATNTELSATSANIDTLATTVEDNANTITNINDQLESLKPIDCIALYDGSITDWSSSNPLEISLSDEVMAAMNNNYNIIQLRFGFGSEKIGVGGEPRVLGLFYVSSWVSGMPIMGGVKAHWVTDSTNKKLYLWSSATIDEALRVVYLCKNI